ncbi:3-isopropylmalate dehydratase large subunit [Aliikangiella sp. IMCC44653]
MVRTLFEKIWDSHLVEPEQEDFPAIIYVDTHYIHEVTSPQAFNLLKQRKLKVRCPERTFATMDHATPTSPPLKNGDYVFNGEREKAQVIALQKNCQENAIRLFELGNKRQGIVHVIGPELGITLPGNIIVCGDSHTSTHGAFGALAFGIGTSEVGHVLATQCLLQVKPKSMGIKVIGKLNAGVSAKDLILHIISKLGVAGATGHVIEYFGEAISELSMEQRMTVCNMSIEAGARAGLIAPDDKTIAYLKGKEFTPKDHDWDLLVKRCRTLYTDKEAQYDRFVCFDATKVKPMITWGTNPAMAIPIRETIPLNANQQAVDYMRFAAGEQLIGKKVNVVFIGSCTNSRLSDLSAVAKIMKGQKVAKNVVAYIVPGSMQVKKAAEQLGLDKIFRDAGAHWREPGCSMCLGLNGDVVGQGELCVSTSNRNFEGRQGRNARTLLVSPETAAHCAILGEIADPQQSFKKGASV